MTRFHRLILLFFIGGIFSCVPLKDLELKSVSGFTVSKIDASGIDSELLLNVKNPNRFGFYIFPSVFDVTYSGIYLGKAQLIKKVRIKGATEESYAFTLKNDFKNVNVMDVLKLLNTGGFKNLIEIKGDLKAGGYILRKKFNIDYKEEIALH